METRLIALKLFLDELGVSFNIDKLDDRKLVQKAVYLGQLFRVDLSYRFGWYLMGPYSPALTKDYYELNEAIALDDKECEGMALISKAQEKLKKARPLLKVPHDFDRSLADWLEIVSSYHYLRQIRGSSEEETIETLNQEKHDLVKFVPQAKEELKKAGLLN